MKLWHDDIRPAPKGWAWARTNEEAKRLLETGNFQLASLDHDLGYHDVEIPEDPDELAEVLLLRGQSEETGLDLVRWMVETKNVPPVIRIHSWNPVGAQAMARVLIDSGLPHSITVEAFEP